MIGRSGIVLAVSFSMVHAAIHGGLVTDLFKRNEQQPDLVTKGSCFWLLVSLVLPVMLHPLGGSLILGPTHRIWVASPISAMAEILYIWQQLIKACIQAIQRRDIITVRQAAFRIIACRLLNIQDGMSRHAVIRTGSNEAQLDLLDNMFKPLNEGNRTRLAINLPIIIQYIKIMVLSGPYTISLRVLGTLYIALWFSLEVLDWIRYCGDTSAVLRELRRFSLQSFQLGASPNSNEFDVNKPLLRHEILLAVVQTGSMGLLLLMCNSFGAKVTGYSSCYIFLASLSWRCIRTTAAQQDVDDMIKGIAADSGVVFMATWIAFCIFDFDSTGTARPHWPWLDWLG